jgi:hypothetical protein
MTADDRYRHAIDAILDVLMDGNDWRELRSCADAIQDISLILSEQNFGPGCDPTPTPAPADTPDRWAQQSAAFQAEKPWCGWTLAFASDSDWDTTGFGLERLVGLSILLTTADGHARSVRITNWQIIVKDDEAGILAHELETATGSYEPRTDTVPEFVRYEDIREIVVY